MIFRVLLLLIINIFSLISCNHFCAINDIVCILRLILVRCHQSGKSLIFFTEYWCWHTFLCFAQSDHYKSSKICPPNHPHSKSSYGSVSRGMCTDSDWDLKFLQRTNCNVFQISLWLSVVYPELWNRNMTWLWSCAYSGNTQVAIDI